MPPVKPFPSYKWRWLHTEPSESLLIAPVYLGVLRALRKHEGSRYSSVGLYKELQRVQLELQHVLQDAKSKINLARTPDRNLFRNSGQYWRGTGLLSDTRGVIQLTDLGVKVAEGQFTQDEFAALMIRNTVLPNPQTYTQGELDSWQRAGLRIKPFELLLSIMSILGKRFGKNQAYITPNELILIVIPLAGAKSSDEEIAVSLDKWRKNELDVSAWPNCAPEDNDGRLAREFLLFLSNFGVCTVSKCARSQYDWAFVLDDISFDSSEIFTEKSFFEDAKLVATEEDASKTSIVPEIIERRRVAAQVLARTGQSRFRKKILEASAGACLLTGESTLDVLEAGHIIPVEHGGTDVVGNGLCLRIDIHRLFDAGKIRIKPNGDVVLNDQIATAVSYSGLPASVELPNPAMTSHLEWRFNYL